MTIQLSSAWSGVRNLECGFACPPFRILRSAFCIRASRLLTDSGSSYRIEIARREDDRWYWRRTPDGDKGGFSLAWQGPFDNSQKTYKGAWQACFEED